MTWHGKHVFDIGRLMGESATKSGSRDAKIGAKWERKSGHGRDQRQWPVTAMTSQTHGRDWKQ